MVPELEPARQAGAAGQLGVRVAGKVLLDR